jgi:prepilin-type N-terminal cleavage/methylation domain-containing protein
MVAGLQRGLRRIEARRRRRGMTVTEMMVVLVIGLVLVAVLTPTISNIFMLEQRQAAKDLALLYEQLHDEAVMRNVTFRVAYNLRNNTYEVQVSEAGALIFDNARSREDFEEEQRRRLNLMSDEEKAEFMKNRKTFSTLEARFKSQFELPRDTVIGGVYTPQYEDMMHLDDFDEDEEPIVYSYIFPNGQAEHAVVHLVDAYDDEDGFTIEIEPLSGNVHLSGELLDWDDRYDFVPDEAPNVPNL